MKKDLTQGTEWKQILLFALPIIAGQILQQLYNTVDGIIVGNFVSEGALAAVGACGTLSFVFLAFAMGMSNGSSIIISQLFGARRIGEMRTAVTTALIMLTAMGIAFALIANLSAEFLIARILAVDDDGIKRLSLVYFRIYSAGLLFQFLYNAVAGILRAIGDSRATLFFLLISACTNIIGDLLLVAVIPLGVAGAAIATVLSQLVCAAASFVYMVRRYSDFRFRLRELVFDGEKCLLCLKMGIPSSFQTMSVSVGNLLIQRLVNGFGTATMAAYTVGNRFDYYLNAPGSSFITAMAAFAGQNTGAGKPERIKRGLRSAVIMDVLIISGAGALIYIFARPLSALFGIGGETLRQAVEFLRFMMLCYPLYAFYMPFNGTFQGCGDPLHSLLIAVLAVIGKVTGSYAMAYLFHVGYSSCWKGNAIGWILGCTLVLIHYRSGKWQKKAIATQTQEAK